MLEHLPSNFHFRQLSLQPSVKLPRCGVFFDTLVDTMHLLEQIVKWFFSDIQVKDIHVINNDPVKSTAMFECKMHKCSKTLQWLTTKNFRARSVN